MGSLGRGTFRIDCRISRGLCITVIIGVFGSMQAMFTEDKAPYAHFFWASHMAGNTRPAEQDIIIDSNKNQSLFVAPFVIWWNHKILLQTTNKILQFFYEMRIQIQRSSGTRRRILLNSKFNFKNIYFWLRTCIEVQHSNSDLKCKFRIHENTLSPL